MLLDKACFCTSNTFTPKIIFGLFYRNVRKFQLLARTVCWQRCVYQCFSALLHTSKSITNWTNHKSQEIRSIQKRWLGIAERSGEREGASTWIERMVGSKFNQVQLNWVFLWFTLLTANWIPLNQTIDWIDSVWCVCVDRRIRSTWFVYAYLYTPTHTHITFSKELPQVLCRMRTRTNSISHETDGNRITQHLFCKFSFNTASWLELMDFTFPWHRFSKDLYVVYEYELDFEHGNEIAKNGTAIIINEDQMGSESANNIRGKKNQWNEINLAFRLVKLSKCLIHSIRI